MKAAWYEKQGAARDVLAVGEMDDPQPRPSEVRIRVAFSGVNPGNVKKREDAFGVGMLYPRVIPHSDGSGTVDAVGEGRERNYGVLCGGSDRVPAIQPQALDLSACGFDLRFGWHIIAADEEESRVHKEKLPDRSLWHWRIRGMGRDGTALCQQFCIGLDVSSESDLYYVMDSIRSQRPDSLH